MNKIEFHFDWEDAGGPQGDELKATWARLSITYNDVPISEVQDFRSRSVKEYVLGPLYPLAEWIAINWWFLLGEAYTPQKSDPKDYWTRHNLMYAQDGYALPNLGISPSGSRAELEWKRLALKHHKTTFLSEGTGSIALDHLEEVLSDFVSQVVSRLDDFDLHDTFLHEEWEAIQRAGEEERKFCRIAASAGLDPYSIDEKFQQSIFEAHDKLPDSMVKEFFSACHAAQMEAEMEAILAAIAKITGNRADLTPIKKIRAKTQSYPPSGFEPWHQGYQAARKLRECLGLNGSPVVEIRDLERVLKLGSDDLTRTIESVPDLPNTITVVNGINSHESPCFVFRRKGNEKMTKFALCRSLYAYFFPESHGPHLVTKSLLDSQKRNRAFAAEFLVPAELLRNNIQHEVITEEEIEELSDEWNVSSMIIGHQIRNHKIAVIERESYLYSGDEE